MQLINSLVTTDLILFSDQEAEDNLRRELSRHLRYCLQSTPMNVTQLQPLWFLLSSDRVGTICCSHNWLS